VNPVIYAADIGSVTAGNFGWARLDADRDSDRIEHDGGTDIAELVEAIAHDLNDRRRGVALGFECPLFVPVPVDALRLGKARPGERDRPWSGGPGTGALATGLVQTAWVLSEIRQRCPTAFAYLGWDEFAAAGVGLFVWEAFVTGEAKAATHADDALVAATTFRDALPAPVAANAVTAERPLSLLSAAMLWSGWTSDLEALHTPCLVIKASPQSPAHHSTPTAEVAVRTATPKTSHGGPLRERLSAKAEQIPAGSWTSYGDIAAMTGSSALPVGTCLGRWPIPNAHRILNAKGKVADGFAFPDGRTDDPEAMLKSEGIRFTDGRADPRQRWRPDAEGAR
jgi:alkylated DNA nucleotide flippase Atl1